MSLCQGHTHTSAKTTAGHHIVYGHLVLGVGRAQPRLQDHRKGGERHVSVRRADRHHGTQWRRQIDADEYSRWLQVSDN